MPVPLIPQQQVVNVNPYGLPVGTYAPFATAYNSLLGTVILSFIPTPSPPNPTILGLNNAILSNISSYYGVTLSSATADIVAQWTAMLGNIYNAYLSPNNPVKKYYTPKQLFLMKEIIKGISEMPVAQAAFTNLSTYYEEVIATSNLSAEEQVPLFMGMAVFETAFTYFWNEIITPSANWSYVIDSNMNVNWINFRRWLVAAFKGVIIGYVQSLPVVPTTASPAVGIAQTQISATAGALVTTFGEIVFNWIPRPHTPLLTTGTDALSRSASW